MMRGGTEKLSDRFEVTESSFADCQAETLAEKMGDD